MKIGVFDPYLNTLGGGEKYMLTAASCLAKRHQVSIFWDDPEVLQKAGDRFGIDISRISCKPNVFSKKYSFLSRLVKTREYDAIFYLSDGSIPVTLSRKLFLHLQFPIPWVNGKRLANRLKMFFVSKIICNSQFTKEYIDKTFSTNSVIVYPPATGEFPRIPMQKTNTILTVGRFGLF